MVNETTGSTHRLLRPCLHPGVDVCEPILDFCNMLDVNARELHGAVDGGIDVKIAWKMHADLASCIAIFNAVFLGG